MMPLLRSTDTSMAALRRHEGRWIASTAQMVEVAVMLLVVTCALGVAAVLLAGAISTVHASATTEAATRAAANAAEAFSADPDAIPEEQEIEGLNVACEVTPEPRLSGTLYRAHITVFDATGTTVYELDTARYVAAADVPDSQDSRSAVSGGGAA